ncbi:MAG TPA: AMP-binding protein [Acidimicrobiales bacterium]|nr:AMP-binding protein [Acidimicrobiales bacterium]
MSGITVGTVDDAGSGTSPTIAGYLTSRRDEGGAGLTFEGSGWTWGDVVEESCRRASLLTQLRRGEPFHIGVLLENVPEYVFLLFGAALCGATVVGINSTRRGSELANDIAHTDCRLVLTDAKGCSLLDGLDLGAANENVIDVESDSYRELLGDPSPLPEDLPGPGQLYLLLFTAGSTGAPKAVRVSQGRAARTAGDSALAFGPDDVLYCAMPLFHGNALLANLFPALIAGASVVLRRRFSASAFGPDIRRHGCTYFNYVGRALSYIVAVPESPDDRNNQLKWALGSEASTKDIAEFSRRFGCPVFEGYGSSENAVVITPAPKMPAGAMGKPRDGMDVIVVNPHTGDECPPARFDPAGRLLNPDEAIGEIVGRNTADRFEGYYNNPEAEAERTRRGWYWTGDLGYSDAQSFFYFAGRSADWLRVDGENFSAGSVERILNRFPPATGVAVYGVPDPVSGDQVMAALEMPGDSGFDPADFEAFVSAQPDLGTKWLPRFVRVVSDLPITGAGKLDKAPLRRSAWITSDALWWREGPAPQYRRFVDSDSQGLCEKFRSNGREAFWPRPAP